MRKIFLEILIIYASLNALFVCFQYINHGPIGFPIESLNQFLPYGDYADESPGVYRPSGIATSPNLFASIFAMIIPICFSLIVEKQFNLNKSIIILALIINLLALTATGSRAGLFMALITSVFLIFKLKFYKHLPNAIKTKNILSITFISILLSIILIPLVIHRLTSIPQAFSPKSGVEYRLSHLKLGLSLAESHFFGVGLNNFQFEIINYFQPEQFFHDSTPAHNIFIELLADIGWIGLMLFILMLFYVIYPSTKSYSPFQYGMLGSLIVYLGVCQLHPWLLERPVADYFYLLSGIYYASKT